MTHKLKSGDSLGELVLSLHHVDSVTKSAISLVASAFTHRDILPALKPFSYFINIHCYSFSLITS